MGDLVYVQLTEDRSLLAGYVSMFLGEFNAAQDLGHMQVCTSLQTDNHTITPRTIIIFIYNNNNNN